MNGHRFHLQESCDASVFVKLALFLGTVSRRRWHWVTWMIAHLIPSHIAPGTLANAALALSYFGEDMDTMIALVDRALTLNPSYARGWYIRGILGNIAGRPDLAIESLEASLRLSPRGRFGQVFNALGVALFFAQRFDEALPKLLLAIQDDPDFPQPHRFLAACYAHLGRLDEARAAAARLRSITPIVVMDVGVYRNPELRELLLSGLRLAASEAS